METFMKKVIWIYWENLPGKSEPAHVTLCRKVLYYQCKNIDIRLVTPENLSDYLPNLPENIHKITLEGNTNQPCLAIKTAFIRAFLLEKYGGLYIDSDAIILRPLDELFDIIQKHEFISTRIISAPIRHISIGLYGSIPNGKIITAYANKLREFIEKKCEYKWGEVGAFTITPIVNNGLKYYVIPERQIQPIIWINAPQLMASEIHEVSDFIDDNTFTFMLFHKVFDTTLRGASIESLYNGSTLISKVFRKSLPVNPTFTVDADCSEPR